MEYDKQHIGERMHKARTECGLTRRFVASKVGVLPQQVCRWERGEQEPSRQNVAGVAAVLGVSPGWLMFGEE